MGERDTALCTQCEFRILNNSKPSWTCVPLPDIVLCQSYFNWILFGSSFMEHSHLIFSQLIICPSCLRVSFRSCVFVTSQIYFLFFLTVYWATATKPKKTTLLTKFSHLVWQALPCSLCEAAVPLWTVHRRILSAGLSSCMDTVTFHLAESRRHEFMVNNVKRQVFFTAQRHMTLKAASLHARISDSSWPLSPSCHMLQFVWL